MEGKPSLSIPYQRNLWLLRLTGPPIAALGIWGFFFPAIALWDAGIGFWLVCAPALFFSAVMGVFGLKITFESFLMVHLVPEGIAVTLFGRELRLYPVEKMKLCVHRRGVDFNWIAVSCLSCEQLVKRREERLRRGFFSKSGVDYKMHRPRWQDWFLQDQLKAESRKALLNPLQMDFLWMEFSWERWGMLRTMYPEILAELSADKVYSSEKPWKDENDYVFCRGWCKETGRLGAKVLMLVLAALPLAAMALVPMDSPAVFWGLLLGMGGIGVLFAGLWLLGRPEYDEFWCCPDRLRITRKGSDLEVIPAEEICTVFRASVEMKGGPRKFMAVSRFTEAELAEKLLPQCRSREARMILRACRQLPEGNRLLLTWYTGRWAALGVQYVPNAQILSHTLRREEVLRERYPSALWIDLGSF